ncbi:hypothetical protein GLI01_23460 [Gluconacetobacter liquefaciens]|uniref:DUF3761 domain-containing protein n=1 Tax=Gluconacetobacter liquefaciens TaxID=89584 RepID=A0A370G535_GLULI|nr:DUF3761 domain-containing protein [Gluconacetobacter liquefaciens]MBB2186489.1 DUF3761 domain-containing protein [Gluconacetobacter liquefaciens]RDI38156.1 uncharacterized protein DUF3761 [Gluconacetobacter liquefaciens]GEB38311.1 hypothetical protein GLI01_23460 [Gluconacetobacter liquefaciens]
MKRILFAIGVITPVLFGGVPAFGFDQTGYHAPQTEPQEQQLAGHGHYVNSNRELVHSPARSLTGQVPVGAVARCGDGTYSFSHHARGTCSHHQGVAEWITEPG